MSKIYKTALFGFMFSSSALADDYGWGEHHHRHHHDDDGYYSPYFVQPRYAPPPPVYYAPAPVVQAYPTVSPGMAAGMAGSAFGYGMSGGNPLAAGIGAAAGSLFGNGMGR